MILAWPKAQKSLGSLKHLTDRSHIPCDISNSGASEAILKRCGQTETKFQVWGGAVSPQWVQGRVLVGVQRAKPPTAPWISHFRTGDVLLSRKKNLVFLSNKNILKRSKLQRLHSQDYIFFRNEKILTNYGPRLFLKRSWLAYIYRFSFNPCCVDGAYVS